MRAERESAASRAVDKVAAQIRRVVSLTTNRHVPFDPHLEEALAEFWSSAVDAAKAEGGNGQSDLP